MKIFLLAAAMAAFAAMSGGALAAEHKVTMLTQGKDGSMVFEPAFVQAAQGDTVRFISTDPSHNSSSVVVPDGATAWKGKMGEELTVTLDREGVYVYQCDPHKVMAMTGVIQVGKAGNLDNAKKEADKLSKSFVMNKDRLAKLMDHVK